MYITVTFLMVFMFAFCAWLVDRREDSLVDVFGPISGCLCFVWVILTIGVCLSYFGHTDDLVAIRTNAKLISIYEDQAKQLSVIAYSQPRQAELTANADSPTAKTIEALANAQAQVTVAKVDKFNAEKSIMERKMGWFWFIVSIRGEQ